MAVLGWQGWPRFQGRFCSFEGLEDLELPGFKDVLVHLNSLKAVNFPGFKDVLVYLKGLEALKALKALNFQVSRTF